ncbi:hypothetical protein SAY86_016014 [Trapa natans]|uniref:FAD-binding PCMH-type domain-containing protein n=1 Tax=Trapa natans TaxID=22666 RepID=A0AAN7LKP4_TRANT|nr:hypothetical protein SAY86_016014 [Trapa natans]
MATSASATLLKFCFSLALFCFPFIAFASDNHTHHQYFFQCLSLNSANSTSISKIIYTPINSTYTSVLDLSIQNLRFRTPYVPKPLVIVTPLDVSEAKAVVYCTRKTGLQLLVRSGGHDYEGQSYISSAPFVILDLSNLRSITIDVEDATAWVGSGATLGEVYYRIGEKSKTLGFPAGICPTVGVGGHFSGGGYGSMMRKYGLAADNIIDAHIIDVNGNLLDRESMGEDHFWAIRGGGGGTFGVVVSWKIKLVVVPETVTILAAVRTENVTNLVHKWQYIAPDFPKELYMSLILQSAVGQDGNPTMRATFNTLYLGGVDELLNITGTRFPELGLTREECLETRWVNSTLIFSGITGQPLETLLNRRSNTRVYFKNKSDYVKEPMSETVLEEIWEWILKEDPGVEVMQWEPYGGRMSEISESALPFPHRAGNVFKIHYMTSWTNGSAEESNRHLNWIRSFYGFMAAHVSKSPRSAYLNYRDLDIGRNNEYGSTSYEQASVWGTKYFNMNFDRLVKVKTAVDPDNFFRNEQSVPPFSQFSQCGSGSYIE